MRIRKALHTDKNDISRVHIASITKLCGRHYSPEQVDAWVSALAPSAYDHALREKVFLVAEDDQQRLSGLGMLDIENAEVSAVYIRPDSVGMGIGNRILKALEKTAEESGITVVTVFSTLNAKGFYLRHGYQEEESTFHRLPGGSKLECIKMIKNLSRRPENSKG
jgi:putative acetyltransferase